MKVKNKYVIRSRISEKKFREIIKYFFIDLNAVQIKKLTGLSRQTINKYLTAFRLRVTLLHDVSVVNVVEGHWVKPLFSVY